MADAHLAAIVRAVEADCEWVSARELAGVALVVEDGGLHGPNPQMTYDMDSAMKSLKKLTRCDIETVICYHGGVYRGGLNKCLAELTSL